MIGRLDHVALGVADLDEAAARWTQQFGLAERARTAARVDLACDDEDVALALEPVAGAAELGHRYVAWRLAKDITLDDAAARLAAHGAPCEREGDALVTQDVEGNAIRLLPYRAPADRRVAHARPAGPAGLRPGHPRKLGHVNFLTGRIHEQVDFYTNVLGLVLTDWLGEDGVWLRPAGGSEHHALAFVNKGYGHLHHVALDLVDIGQMRDALDHLGRCGRWLGWGPTRHGVGGNIASYVRITEEPLFVELYCDMERLAPDHEPRVWPDDRYSSNTWGPLPPRSYFRFDPIAVDSERESLEALGHPLPDPPVETHA